MPSRGLPLATPSSLRFLQKMKHEVAFLQRAFVVYYMFDGLWPPASAFRAISFVFLALHQGAYA